MLADMGKDKKVQETQDNIENTKKAPADEHIEPEALENSEMAEKGKGPENSEVAENGETPVEAADEAADKGDNGELEEIKRQLESMTKKCDEYFDMLQRTAAEFDNYKKRTVKEKEALYSEAVSSVVTAFLPVIDSVERALLLSSDESSDKSIREGIELINKQIKSVMKNLGVEEIKSIGETFNPDLHNAVMHIEDDSYGQNVVVEEFQKGYKFKDKVIRYSMVKVAN